MTIADRTRAKARDVRTSPQAAGFPPSRVVVENVRPEVDAGRFPIKRVVGERVVVEADVFAEGHDVLGCALRFKREGAGTWDEVRMEALPNDLWRGAFTVDEMGTYRYTVRAWADPFSTWRRDLAKRAEAGQDLRVPLQIGASIVRAVADRASGADARQLQAWADLFDAGGAGAVELGLGDEVAARVGLYPDLDHATSYERELTVVVERTRARYSAWYELFPRSAAAQPGKHGTFRDVEKRLEDIAGMGFDVLYLPPIHPIGRTHRKGKNNVVTCEPGDVGSPWAIGGPEGGHTAIHPDLGTVEDFRRLVAKAHDHGMEIALDLAYQCSPDHPWVREHPQWFRHRPDGSIQYAENPPKKYQDIYPVDFETADWRALWDALRGVVTYWIEQGVRIFRVDNPHTKPFPFWEWLIGGVRSEHPDVLFLSEAFTRPKIMYRLAKLGFTQSYTYFAWRNTKWELAQYLEEITRPPVSDFFRPNLWPNTPDILTEYLQYGGRPAFMTRLVLAATLGANYGIYGPAFELCENIPREQGSEEYRDSEKYEIRNWDLGSPESLQDLVGRLNRIRRDNPALQADQTLRFHDVDNKEMICYSKTTDDFSNVILVVVNLDFRHTQSGWVELPLDYLQIDAQQPFQVHDLLTDARYLWHGSRNYVELVPDVLPAHVFRIRRRLRVEKDFDYYT